ncbi:spore germination lipoprotein GerD [Paenibacillus mendelii]|nr:spore germination lipoprotein GerD [Paenibacillus mendelii]
MFKRSLLVAASAMLAVVLTGCGSEPSSGQSEAISYKDIKTMVIDILKTEDAQKALQESSMSGSSGLGSKIMSVQDQEQVRLAVKDTLVSPDYHKVIEKLMTDPKFAGEFAKSVSKENKQLHKDLIKDPTYQSDLIKVLKNPEMEKIILEVLDSTQYRKQISTIMQESMQSPLYRLEILELLKKAVQEELKPKTDQKPQKSGEQQGGGGEEGGGEDSEGMSEGE